MLGLAFWAVFNFGSEQQLFDDEKQQQLDGVQYELSKLRIIFSHLMDMVLRTSTVLAPTILFVSISSAMQVSTTVYGTVKEAESKNYPWIILKTSFGILAFFKFACLCFSASCFVWFFWLHCHRHISLQNQVLWCLFCYLEQAGPIHAFRPTR